MISHANPLHELAGWTTRTKNEDEIVATDQLGRGHQRDPHLPPRQRLHQETMRRDDSRAHSLRSATTSLLKTLLPNLENRSCTSCCGSGNPLDSTARVEMSLAELMDRVEVLERKLGDTAMSVPVPNSPCRLVRASPSSRLVDTFVELHLETKTRDPRRDASEQTNDVSASQPNGGWIDVACYKVYSDGLQCLKSGSQPYATSSRR